MICAMSVAAAVAPDEYRSRRRSSERARRTASTYRRVQGYAGRTARDGSPVCAAAQALFQDSFAVEHRARPKCCVFSLIPVTAPRDGTGWLRWSDSNSETSSQNIPLKGRSDCPDPAEFWPQRLFAFELRRPGDAARPRARTSAGVLARTLVIELPSLRWQELPRFSADSEMIRRPPIQQGSGRPAGFPWNYGSEIIVDGVIHALGICSGLIGAVIIIVIASHSTKIVTITSVLIYAAGLVAMLLSCGGTLRPNFCFCSEMVRTGPMRRFFFQVKDGSTFNDEDGENLPSIEAARAHAARIANELAQEGALGAWRSK